MPRNIGWLALAWLRLAERLGHYLFSAGSLGSGSQLAVAPPVYVIDSVRVVSGRLAVALLVMSACCVFAVAAQAATDKHDLRLQIETSADATPAGDGFLSAPAAQLAEQLNIMPLIQAVRAEKQAPGSGDATKHLLQRQDLFEAVCVASFEVRAAVARIDAEIALADDLRAQLEERRDRALKLTTMANLVTGSVNGIGGSGMEIADKLELPAKIMDVIEGGVETGLAWLALREQRGERRLSGPIGGLLLHFFQEDNKLEDFPDSVSTFMCTVPAGSKSGLTRRQELIDRWRQMGIFRRHNESRWEHRVKHIAAGASGKMKKPVTLSVLEDREAMLHDVRASVADMDLRLLEIMRAVRTVR